MRYRLLVFDFGAAAWGYTKPQALLARAPVFLFEHPEQILRALEAM
jgi:hypothetical protein